MSAYYLTFRILFKVEVTNFVTTQHPLVNIFGESRKEVAFGEESHKSVQNLSNLMLLFVGFVYICKISAPKGNS